MHATGEQCIPCAAGAGLSVRSTEKLRTEKLRTKGVKTAREARGGACSTSHVAHL